MHSEFKKKKKFSKLEGYSLGWWVLLDYGDCIVHILQEDAREHYGFDHLWADAKHLPLEAQKTKTPKEKKPIRKARKARSRILAKG